MGSTCYDLRLLLACALHIPAARTFARTHTMYLRYVYILFAGVLIARATLAQSPPPPTLETLVAKNVEAKGGADAIKALQSLRLSGKMLVNEGQIEFTYTQIKKRPDEVRPAK